jgi:hypothetical protein
VGSPEASPDRDQQSEAAEWLGVPEPSGLWDTSLSQLGFHAELQFGRCETYEQSRLAQLGAKSSLVARIRENIARPAAFT